MICIHIVALFELSLARPSFQVIHFFTSQGYCLSIMAPCLYSFFLINIVFRVGRVMLKTFLTEPRMWYNFLLLSALMFYLIVCTLYQLLCWYLNVFLYLLRIQWGVAYRVSGEEDEKIALSVRWSSCSSSWSSTAINIWKFACLQ